jgi:O-antigen ligase
MFRKKANSCSYDTPRFFFYLGVLTIGQTVIRPALGFTMSDWLFLISLFLTISECLLRRNIEIIFPKIFMLGLFIFMIGGIISSGFSKITSSSIISLFKFFYLIAVWFWLCTTILNNMVHIKSSIILWTSSAALSGLGSIMQLFWKDIIPGVSPLSSRMTGLTEHMNDLGGLTSIALIPAIMMSMQLPKKSYLFIYSCVCTILIAGGLVLSVSMTGMVAVITSLILWIILSRVAMKKIYITSFSAVLFFVFILIQNHYEGFTIVSRINDISDKGIYLFTLQTRLDTYSVAWESIRDNPFFGVGLGPDSGLTKTGYVVHNIFLANWYECGLFGLIGILLIVGTIALEAFKWIKTTVNNQDKQLGNALLSSYIAFLVMGIAQPIYFKRFGWISAALLLALYSIRKCSIRNIYQTNQIITVQNKQESLISL